LVIFGAQLSVNIPFFILSIIVSIAEIFSLGLLVAALVPWQTVARFLSGLLAFLLTFSFGPVDSTCSGGRAVGNDHQLLTVRCGGAGITRLAF